MSKVESHVRGWRASIRARNATLTTSQIFIIFEIEKCNYELVDSGMTIAARIGIMGVFCGDMVEGQILNYGAQGASVGEIAGELGVGEEVVKLVLQSKGGVSADNANDRDITDDELKLLRRRGVDIALQSENEIVAASLIKFFIERDKPVKQAPPPTPVNHHMHIHSIVQRSNEQFKSYLTSYGPTNNANPSNAAQVIEARRDTIPAGDAGTDRPVEESSGE